MDSFYFLFGELDEQMCNIIWGILQVLGILLGGCLTVKNYWELLTGDDGGCFSGVIVLSISHSPTFF